MSNNLDFLDKDTSTVDTILQIDEDSNSSINSEFAREVEDEDPAENLTKPTFVTSPWSKLGVVALVFGIGFSIVFLVFSGILNSNSQAENEEAPSKIPEETLAKLEKNDGDIFAQAALGQQESELKKINEKQPVIQEANTAQTPQVTVPPSSPAPTPVNSVQPEARVNSSPVRPLPPPPTPTPQSNFSITRDSNAITTDPIAELNRLRRVGSFGSIAYTANENESLFASQRTLTRIEEEENELPITSPHQITPNALSREGIEKIEPRWQVEKRSRQAEVNDFKIASVNFLPQEAQIINERRSRYLVVGEFASGTLITPLVKEQSNRNNQQNEDGKRYVARLTEDLKDNYGNVAIARGSLMALEILRVDGANYAEAQVTSIIKDNTEYPISAGAITVQGEGGRPLIAQQFQDKGGEIARYDLTVGLFSGLGKVGEIINQPDIEDDIEDELLDGRIRRRRRVNNSRRNITGAVLEGAFGSLSEIIGRRAETSTQEILARPNVWYIPRNTKVTFLVNRTLELP
ncbi:hypothetical protein IQ243_20470 [Nostocales cyanobacterium LEGE 11386]|nr:hypothetical protein [Nostocales cyanobacterium LEGE 11386]